MKDDWKIELLKRMWNGEESDLNKLEPTKDPIKKKETVSKWPEIDLHKYHQLSDQLAAAEKAIDAAIAVGMPGIIIIHGKGEGILRQELFKSLKHHARILEYKPIQDVYGESGAIKIKFK